MTARSRRRRVAHDRTITRSRRSRVAIASPRARSHDRVASASLSAQQHEDRRLASPCLTSPRLASPRLASPRLAHDSRSHRVAQRAQQQGRVAPPHPRRAQQQGRIASASRRTKATRTHDGRSSQTTLISSSSHGAERHAYAPLERARIGLTTFSFSARRIVPSRARALTFTSTGLVPLRGVMPCWT